MSDIEILEEMKAQVGSCESIFLVPWASQWARGGPFCIAQTELRDFIQAFKSEIGEPFFSGDTWILCPKLNRILLLQHEWIFAQVDLKGIA